MFAVQQEIVMPAFTDHSQDICIGEEDDVGRAVISIMHRHDKSTYRPGARDIRSCKRRTLHAHTQCTQVTYPGVCSLNYKSNEYSTIHVIYSQIYHYFSLSSLQFTNARITLLLLQISFRHNLPPCE